MREFDAFKINFSHIRMSSFTLVIFNISFISVFLRSLNRIRHLEKNCFYFSRISIELDIFKSCFRFIEVSIEFVTYQIMFHFVGVSTESVIFLILFLLHWSFYWIPSFSNYVSLPRNMYRIRYFHFMFSLFSSLLLLDPLFFKLCFTSNESRLNLL